MNDLLQILNKLGIEPLGSDSVDATAWVEHKEVDPLDTKKLPEVIYL